MAKRAPIEVEVWAWTESEPARLLTGVTVELGDHGAVLRLPKLCDAAARLTLRITLPDRPDPDRGSRHLPLERKPRHRAVRGARLLRALPDPRFPRRARVAGTERDAWYRRCAGGTIHEWRGPPRRAGRSPRSAEQSTRPERVEGAGVRARQRGQGPMAEQARPEVLGELRGQNFAAAVMPDSLDAARIAFARKIMGTEQAADYDAMLRSGARSRPRRDQLGRLHGSDRIVGVFGVIHFDDITEQPRAGASSASDAAPARGARPPRRGLFDRPDHRHARAQPRDGAKPHPGRHRRARRPFPARSRWPRRGREGLLDD